MTSWPTPLVGSNLDSIFNETEDKHIGGGSFTFTLDLHLVKIPKVGPCSKVEVDEGEEYGLKKPEVSFVVDIEATFVL